MTTKFLFPGGISILANVIACSCIHAQPLPRSTPEAEGISSQAIVEFVEAADENAMKVRDLLTMSGGHEVEPKAAGGGPSVKQFLAQPVIYPPGIHFLYNTMGSYVLSAIVTKVTGQTSLEYLRPRLFDPLGIEDPRWDSGPEGNSLGGYGLHRRAEDMAKFGQLYLQKGRWNGKPLIPRKWVEEAISKQISNDKEAVRNRPGLDRR